VNFKADQIVTLIEVFHDNEVAQAAIRELREVGFSESQIDVTSTIRKGTAHGVDGIKAKNSQIIVSVKAGTRADIAASVLNRFNRFDRTPAQAM
jgi:hypothetical protein